MVRFGYAIDIENEGRLRTKLYYKREMILIFLLWTFHLYVKIFQQCLHMEYIGYSRACGSCHDSLHRWSQLTRKLLN